MKSVCKKYIELCSTEKYTVIGFDVVNGATRVSKYVGITILDKRGIPRLGGDGSYIKVKRESILNSKDAELGVLRRFSIGLEESHYREAMTNLRRGLQRSSEVLEDCGDKDIFNVYCDLYEIAMEYADKKDEEGVDKVQVKSSAIWVRDNILDELLERADYTDGKTAFCKELYNLGELIGESLIERNRGMGSGFSSNTTVKNSDGISVQRRYIRINKINKLLEKEE